MLRPLRQRVEGHWKRPSRKACRFALMNSGVRIARYAFICCCGSGWSRCAGSVQVCKGSKPRSERIDLMMLPSGRIRNEIGNGRSADGLPVALFHLREGLEDFLLRTRSAATLAATIRARNSAARVSGSTHSRPLHCRSGRLTPRLDAVLVERTGIPLARLGRTSCNSSKTPND